jgi:hypothetical protein
MSFVEVSRPSLRLEGPQPTLTLPITAQGRTRGSLGTSTAALFVKDPPPEPQLPVSGVPTIR